MTLLLYLVTRAASGPSKEVIPLLIIYPALGTAEHKPAAAAVHASNKVVTRCDTSVCAMNPMWPVKGAPTTPDACYAVGSIDGTTTLFLHATVSSRWLILRRWVDLITCCYPTVGK